MRGFPPSVPGGGMTGIVPGVGSGTVPWMPGSTPSGGRMTPRPTPPPSRSSTTSSPVGPPPERSRVGAAGSPPGRDWSTSGGAFRRASGADEAPCCPAAGSTAPSRAASAAPARAIHRSAPLPSERLSVATPGITTIIPFRPAASSQQGTGRQPRGSAGVPHLRKTEQHGRSISGPADVRGACRPWLVRETRCRPPAD